MRNNDTTPISVRAARTPNHPNKVQGYRKLRRAIARESGQPFVPVPNPSQQTFRLSTAAGIKSVTLNVGGEHDESDRQRAEFAKRKLVFA